MGRSSAITIFWSRWVIATSRHVNGNPEIDFRANRIVESINLINQSFPHWSVFWLIVSKYNPTYVRQFYRSADADIEILLTGSWLVGLPRLRLPRFQGRSRACQFHGRPFENTPQSKGRSGTSGSAHTGSEIISIWKPISTWKKLSRAVLLSSTSGTYIIGSYLTGWFDGLQHDCGTTWRPFWLMYDGLVL